MGKKNSISFRTVFYYIVIIGFLFPRGYGEINTTYHSVCSLFMWISVVLVLIQSLNKTKIKVSIRKIKIHKENIWLRGYFIAAILITAFCRKSFSSGLQQLFAAPCVCIFMLLNLKQYPEKILNIIMNVLCIEFTLNALLSHPYINGVYHIIFLGHIQVVSQYEILAALVGTAYLLLYHKKKKKIYYLYLITLYTTFTTDVEAAAFTAIGLLIALLIYKLKASQILKMKSNSYVIAMMILSVTIIYLSVTNVRFLPNININGRMYVWQDAMQKIIAHPIFGYGIDGVVLNTFWTTDGFNYAHNQLVQNFLDGGIVLVIFFWMMIFQFSTQINAIKNTKYKVLCNATLIALLFVMLFESTTLYIYMYMILTIEYMMVEMINVSKK